MTKTPNRKSGFVLVEVLISVAILLMLASTGIGLVTMGYRAISFNAHSIEATWLAQQGANSLRGLRDTNWLRFGYNKTDCWKIVGDACATGTPLDTGNYIIDISLSGPITLETVTTDLDLADGIAGDEKKFQLVYTDRDIFNDSDGDGDDTNDEEYLAHKAITLGAVSPSLYYRIVKITNATDPNIEASIEVHWLESGAPKKIAIPVTLTNYYRET
jgi:prepilin-type N-terminal cleavage/methylation domain-containing protein